MCYEFKSGAEFIGLSDRMNIHKLRSPFANTTKYPSAMDPRSHLDYSLLGRRIEPTASPSISGSRREILHYVIVIAVTVAIGIVMLALVVFGDLFRYLFNIPFPDPYICIAFVIASMGACLLFHAGSLIRRRYSQRAPRFQIGLGLFLIILAVAHVIFEACSSKRLY